MPDDKDITRSQIEELVAVALKYDMENREAPQVAAKGSGFLAQQILEIAKAQDIPIHKDADLVEILSVLDVDSFIPLEAYTAVAELLSYIYKKNGALDEGGNSSRDKGRTE
jgi:flagellar biosynthesis protein